MRPDIDAIRARAEKATKGLWRCDYQPSGICGSKCYTDTIKTESLLHTVIGNRPRKPINANGDYVSDRQILDNGIFIASARTDIPDLLDYVKELETAIKPFADDYVQQQMVVQLSDDSLVNVKYGWLRRAAELVDHKLKDGE